MTMLKDYLNSINIIAYCDAAEAWQLGVQDPATPVMEGMIFFPQLFIIFLNSNWGVCMLVIISCNYQF